MINSSDPANTASRITTTPTVVAPGLAAAGVETCLGSAAGGLSLMGGGFTFGTTKVDEGCTIRLLARQLYAFGFHNAAMALMCEDRHVVTAMAAVGSPCPPAVAEVATTGSITALPTTEETSSLFSRIFSSRPPEQNSGLFSRMFASRPAEEAEGEDVPRRNGFM